MTSTKQTLLVTGAAGHLGRRVIEQLLQANAGPIIATTRTPDKLTDLAARGVEVRYADFDQPDTLAPAFAGADRLLLISTDTLSVPGQRLAQHKAAIAAAVQAGVSHVLYTSAPRATDPGHPALVVPDHRGTEEALANSPLDWTVLRNNIYAEIRLMSLPQAIAMGQILGASGQGGVSYISREDCARAAASALAATTTGRTTLEITGPEVVTYAELARLASELSGKPIHYVALSSNELQTIFTSAGMPATIAEVMVSFDTAAAQGYLGIVTNAVKDLTGQAPQSLRAFLTDHREALLAPRA